MTPELLPIYEPEDKYSFMYEELNGVPVKVGEIAVEGAESDE